MFCFCVFLIYFHIPSNHFGVNCILHSVNLRFVSFKIVLIFMNLPFLMHKPFYLSTSSFQAFERGNHLPVLIGFPPYRQLLSLGKRRGRSIGNCASMFFLRFILSRFWHRSNAVNCLILFLCAVKLFKWTSSPTTSGTSSNLLSSMFKTSRADNCAKSWDRSKSWFFERSSS